MGYAVAGPIALIVADRLIVVAAKGIGADLGLDPFVVGATLVALGTSSPVRTSASEWNSLSVPAWSRCYWWYPTHPGRCLAVGEVCSSSLQPGMRQPPAPWGVEARRRLTHRSVARRVLSPEP